MKIASKYLLPIALLLMSIIGAAYAAATLFTQTFPSVPASGPPVFTSNCAILSAHSSSVSAGSSGAVGFDCSGSAPFGTIFAFNVSTTAPTPASRTATPSFTLPLGYTSLNLFYQLYFPGQPPPPCPASQAAYGSPLHSGTPVTIPAGGQLYCATYSNAPSTGLDGFTITWT